MDINDFRQCEDVIKFLKTKSPREVKKYLKYLEQRTINDFGNPQMDEIFEKVVNDNPKQLHYVNHIDEEEEGCDICKDLELNTEDCPACGVIDTDTEEEEDDLDDEDYEPGSDDDGDEDEEDIDNEIKQIDTRDKRYIEIKLSL